MLFVRSCPARHPKFKEAEREVVRAARAAKKPLGTCIYGGDMYNPDTYKRFLDEGFRLLLVGGDEWMLSAACRKLVGCVAKATTSKEHNEDRRPA